jgi:hypothetical protein
MYNQDTSVFAKFNNDGEFIEISDSDLQDGVDSESTEEHTIYRIYKKIPENAIECPHNYWPVYSDVPELIADGEDTIAVYPMTLTLKEGDDLQTAIETTSKQVREERNEILGQSDYVILRAYENGGSVPAEWISYRQSLRDLPQHSSFPFLTAADWPSAPE